MAWVRPTGYSDPDNVWTSETLAYDGWTNTGTVSESVPPGSWTGLLELIRTAIQCDKIRFNVTSAYYEYPADVEIRVYYNGAYHSIYEGVFSPNTWIEKSLGAVYSVTKASLNFHINNSEEVNRYGKIWEFNFNQLTAPTVTTQATSDILLTSVQGNGNITNTGGINCTTRGFCYMVGTTGNPTTANSKAYDTGSFGTGAYNKTITGLSIGTNYRVRAYAINSAGTGYGTTVQVTTRAYKVLTSTANIAISITSSLSRTYALTSTINIATSITSVLSRGITEAFTSTTAIVISITATLSRGATEALTSTANIATSIISTLTKEVKAITSTANIVTSIIGKILKDYISLTKADRVYKSVTKADKVYTPVSDITPSGTVEEKFIWNYINPNYDTWVELLAKEHWCDWYFATPFTDAWSSLITPTKTYTSVTAPTKTYNEVTTPDRTFASVTTPASTFTGVSDVTPSGTIEEKFTWVYIDDSFDTWVELLAKEHWCDWYFATVWTDNYDSVTTPDKTYTGVTKPEDGYSPVTTPDKEYKEVTKHQIDV